MNIRNKKKVKNIDNLKALYQDCRAVEKVSLFGAFILCYILSKKLGVKEIRETKKLYNGLLKGYEIPKYYSLCFKNNTPTVMQKGKITIINLKAFNRNVFKQFSK